ncbi:MAG: FAD-dependent oxidoreductase [Thermomicrobium sp.]|nr:FAD-dependent oxidoreductase [Thermomicrobium sp.]
MASIPRTTEPSVIVIGGGIGGLAAAAAIANAGVSVIVLEAHVYPGGCAATFRHRGRWYDAGATLLAGFAPGGPMQLLGRAAGIRHWPVRPTELALTVYLEDGTVVARVARDARWDFYRSAFPTSLPFWHWQEATAALLWDFALRLPEIQPRSWASLRETLSVTGEWLLRSRPSPQLLLDLLRPVARRLPEDPRFRRFVDAQLLIAAQATADEVYALYGAAALDLPNRGVVEPAGGAGAIARTLVDAVRRHSGTVHFRQEVVEIERTQRTWRVRTQRGLELAATHVVADLTPWALARLWNDAPAALRRRTERPPAGWSAFLTVPQSRRQPHAGDHGVAPSGPRAGTARRRELGLRLVEPGLGRDARPGRSARRDPEHPHDLHQLVEAGANR